MTSAWLYILQRASAMIMAPLVIAHLLLIIYAMRGGITAGPYSMVCLSSLLPFMHRSAFATCWQKWQDLKGGPLIC